MPSVSCCFPGILFVAAAWSAVGPATAAQRQPNVIFFLIDDLGFTDLACTGSQLYETPHLDRLASEGMKFTHAYSACTVCSPTRAATLTGKYPARLHITDWIAGHKRPNARLKIPDWTQYLPHDEVTIAERLKEAGYATASVGKWHLGGAEYGPTTQGFDVNLGGTQAGSPPGYFGPAKLPGIELAKDESLTERLTAEAIRFVETNKDKPFFVYFPHYTVHTPLQARPEVVERYRKKIEAMQLDAEQVKDYSTQHPQNNAVYAAMIESMDDSVGGVMAALDRLGLSDDTIIFFTGDNGGLMRSTDNRPARVGKGSAYEGGVRVPLIVRYPKAIAAGSTSDAAVMSIDYFPTILELCGLPAAKQPNAQTPATRSPIDGVSVAPVLKQTGPLARTELFWHYPHYHPGGATPYGAIRDGDWRLVEFYEDNHVELYNLRDDVGEKNDLAAKDPSRADALQKRLHAWRAEVGAQMPTSNPDYDAEKDAAQDRNRAAKKPAVK
jgi:arylsulfatase A-like enzyme